MRTKTLKRAGAWLLAFIMAFVALTGYGFGAPAPSAQAQSEQPATDPYYLLIFDFQMAREGLDDGSYNCAAHRRPWSQQMLRSDGARSEAWHVSPWNMECTGIIHLGMYLQIGQTVTAWVKPDSWTAVYFEYTNTSCTDELYGCRVSIYSNPMYAGDASDDNVVNATDYNILRATYGKSCYDDGYDGRAEFTGDCLVNAADWNLYAGNFGVAGVGQLFYTP